MGATTARTASAWAAILVASLTAACGNGEGPVTRLSGTVTGREPSALPPGAVIEVRLEEAAAAGASSAPVAEQTVDTDGQQLPIPFTLDVPRSALEANRSYVLTATVRSATGEVLLATPADQPPLENPNTTSRVELVVGAPP